MNRLCWRAIIGRDVPPMRAGADMGGESLREGVNPGGVARRGCAITSAPYIELACGTISK